jgi:hypothetical protein
MRGLPSSPPKSTHIVVRAAIPKAKHQTVVARVDFAQSGNAALNAD